MACSSAAAAFARSDSATKPASPVRVRLKRISSEFAKPYPPDGVPREWWQALKRAFGTASSAFVNASLTQLVAAARLPCSGISEVAVNASLAFIEGAKPQDEIECALVMQMACTHTAAMAVLGTLGGAHGSNRNVALKASAAARLLRAYVAQVEVLRRLRTRLAKWFLIRRRMKMAPATCWRERAPRQGGNHDMDASESMPDKT
jgi:hypothetical protein